MDKGLKILEELQLKLVELENQDEENDKLLDSQYEYKTDLVLRITSSEKSLKELNAQKKMYEQAPIKKKKEIKSLLKEFLIVYGIFFIIMIGMGLFMGDILPALKMILMTGALSSIVFIPAINFGINQKYPSGDIAEIERKIEHHVNNVKNIEKELTVVYSKIHDLEEIEKDLETKIDEVVSRIDSIQKVRSEVINAYLKDNKELDNLLDNAYDNEIEKGKQKTKK